MAYISQERKKELAPKIKEVLKKYGMKGTIATRHYSSLVVNVSSGKIDFEKFMTHGRNYIQVNEYYIGDHYDGVAKDFLLELIQAMRVGNWDNSDAQSDYFDVGRYTDINIGNYDKPYLFIK